MTTKAKRQGNRGRMTGYQKTFGGSPNEYARPMAQRRQSSKKVRET
jgi:hypothetical protein